MKDAFGGSFLLRIMIVFFVIFICFMSVSIKYVLAFNAKNYAINILSGTSDVGEAKDKILLKLNSISYSVPKGGKAEQHCLSKNDPVNYVNAEFIDPGLCIVSKDGSNRYQIYSYYVLNMSVFDLDLVFPISGESFSRDIKAD